MNTIDRSKEKNKSSSDIYDLTSYEQYFTNCCKVGDLQVMGIALLKQNSKQNDGDKELKKSMVEQALHILQDRHPFLHAYIENTTSSSNRSSMQFVLIDSQDDYRKRIEFDWVMSNSRQKTIELNAAFNARLLDLKKVIFYYNFNFRPENDSFFLNFNN